MAKILSLTGGGMRGLYTATVLSEIQSKLEGEGIDFCYAKHCDLIGGTSIGGIIALGLAAKIPPAKIAEIFEEDGPSIFPSRFKFARKIKGIFLPLYDNKTLSNTISRIFKESPIDNLTAESPIKNLATSVSIVAFELVKRELVLINSEEDNYKDMSILDACLATSAAPTYFPPIRIGKQAFIDGGVACNMPDSVLLTQFYKFNGVPASRMEILSVGTTYDARLPTNSFDEETNRRGYKSWLLRRKKQGIIDIIMDAQMSTQKFMFENLPSTIKSFRIDGEHGQTIELDDSTERARDRLKECGKITWNKDLTTYFS
jgi:patatin-like phospholipase/acyl hydrolase